jgi:hypothetical protein
MPQPHEWHDPLYYVLQTLAWIATSGSHEMQKYPLEVVYAAPVSVSTAAGQYSTSIGNSRKLFQDKYGKYFAFWKDGNTSPHTYLGYSSTSPPTSGWTANDLGANFYLYGNDERYDPAAAYDSTNDRVMLIFSRMSSANVGIAQVTFNRDVNHNVTGYTPSSVTEVSLPRACVSPSAWMLHNGEVAVIYGDDDILGQATENHVEFFRAVFGNPPTYKNAAGGASTVNTLQTYNTNYTDSYATIVERTNSGTGQYDLYAFWMMTRGATLHVTSRQAKATWNSPNWSWGSAAASTATINGPPTANYDTTTGLIVYASANKIAAGTQVNVGTINASDSGSDISATGLTSDTRASPTIAIDQTNGNYYIFYERTDKNLYYIDRTGGSWGSETSFTSGANENYPSAKVDGTGNRIELIWTHYTGSAYNVYYDYISLPVTQPITLILSTAGAPTATFTLSGCTVSPSTVLGDGVSHSVTATPSCSVTVTVPTDSSNTRYRFSGGATTWSFTTCAGGTCSGQTQTYYYQLRNTYQANPLAQMTWDSGLSGPSVTGTVLGTAGTSVCTITLPGGGGAQSCAGWADYNLAVTLGPISGAPANSRWQSSGITSFTQTTGGNTNNVNYYKQYLQILSYSVSGGGGPTAPSYTANQFGLSTPQILTTIPTGYWFDNSASWTVTNPLGGSSGSEQWITSQSTSGTISSAQTLNFSYQHQYQLTMQAGTGGSVAPVSGWQNSGANVTITATPNGGYAFTSWTCTGIGCYSGTNNPWWVVMNAAITETGNFNQVIVTIRVDNLTLSATSGGANMTAPQNVNPTVEYWYGAGAYDSQYTTDIQSITIDLYRTGHAAGFFDKSFVYSFRWVANGWSGTPSCATSPGCWQELQSSGWVASSFTYLVSSDSSVTTISGSVLTAKWQFAVKLDQLAVYRTNGAGLWNLKVTAVSKSSGNASAVRAGTVDVNLLISVTVPGNMDWGTVAAGSVNGTASGMPAYTTYTANAIVSITVYGGGDPTNQYGDSFPLSYIYVGKTSNPANNDGAVLSTSPRVFYSSLPVAANSNLPMYWFVSTPNPFTPGSYTFTYYETIQLQSMQP